MESSESKSKTHVSEFDKQFKQETLLHIIFQQFLEHRLAVISGIVLVFMVVISFSAPLISWATGLSYTEQDINNRFQGSSISHPLGTDELGRDVMMRVLYGGRISLLVGLLSALGAAFLGTLIGAIAGYYGGFIDAFLMRVTDSFMSIPILPLMIIFSAVDNQNIPFLAWFPENYANVVKIIAIVIIFSWMQAARLVRGSVLTVKEQEFVLASKGLGASNARIIFSHILPNVISPVIVSASLAIGGNILYEAALSFLGLGIEAPLSSWGNMLNNFRMIMNERPILAFYPGIMIFVTVLSFNFFGDGLQDAIDPKGIKR